MLKLIWVPTLTGAPDKADYRRASDDLRIGSATGDVLQSFRKSVPFQGLPTPALAACLDQWCGTRQRVVLLAHGFAFDPTSSQDDDDNPFHGVYGVPGPQLDPRASWLPLVGETDETGQVIDDHAIAFAWVSTAGIRDYARASWSNPYEFAVFDLAPLAAKALATVIAHLAARGVTIDILAHSLGTRLVSQAIGLLRAEALHQRIGRVVLLGGAEFCVDAQATLIGKAEAVFNIASRQDLVLSKGAQEFCHPVREVGSAAARVIGREGLRPLDRWLDLQLDHAAAAEWLAARGYPVSAQPENTIHRAGALGHWVYYTNEGNRALVHDLMTRADRGMNWFRDDGFPAGIDSPLYGTLDPHAAIPPIPQTAVERAFLHVND